MRAPGLEAGAVLADLLDGEGKLLLIGANAEAIATAEDRERFKQAMIEIGLAVPASGTARSLDEAMLAHDDRYAGDNGCKRAIASDRLYVGCKHRGGLQ